MLHKTSKYKIATYETDLGEVTSLLLYLGKECYADLINNVMVKLDDINPDLIKNLTKFISINKSYITETTAKKYFDFLTRFEKTKTVTQDRGL